ncbi:MAG: hypothetical protein OXC37_03230, partial [Bdellovibrionaceae bacterium]|nr:hypothetical protein [Pseudobdellovibrionaceae bacterium]
LRKEYIESEKLEDIKSLKNLIEEKKDIKNLCATLEEIKTYWEKSQKAELLKYQAKGNFTIFDSKK